MENQDKAHIAKVLLIGNADEVQGVLDQAAKTLKSEWQARKNERVANRSASSANAKGR